MVKSWHFPNHLTHAHLHFFHPAVHRAGGWSQTIHQLPAWGWPGRLTWLGEDGETPEKRLEKTDMLNNLVMIFRCNMYIYIYIWYALICMYACIHRTSYTVYCTHIIETYWNFGMHDVYPSSSISDICDILWCPKIPLTSWGPGTGRAEARSIQVIQGPSFQWWWMLPRTQAGCSNFTELGGLSVMVVMSGRGGRDNL